MRGIFNTLRIAGVAAMAAGLAFAQSPAPAERPQYAQHMKAHRGEARAQRMAAYLGLTDQQKAQAKTIFEGARDAAKPLHDQLRQVRSDLRAAIRDGKPVDQLAATQGELVGKLTAIRAGSAERFRALLTPEQVQKLDQRRASRQAQPQG